VEEGDLVDEAGPELILEADLSQELLQKALRTSRP